MVVVWWCGLFTDNNTTLGLYWGYITLHYPRLWQLNNLQLFLKTENNELKDKINASNKGLEVCQLEIKSKYLEINDLVTRKYEQNDGIKKINEKLVIVMILLAWLTASLI